MANTKKAVTAKKFADPKPQPANGKRGRVGQFEGKKIQKLMPKWLGRENTKIAASANLVRTGMSYTTYIQQGGRYIDLVDMIKQGFVAVQ
jgi:Rieske Fe-S protein